MRRKKQLLIMLILLLMVLFETHIATSQEEDTSYISLYAKVGQNPNWDGDKLFELRQQVKRMDMELQTALTDIRQVQASQALLSRKVTALLRGGEGIQSRRTAEIQETAPYKKLLAEMKLLNEELDALIARLIEVGLLEPEEESEEDGGSNPPRGTRKEER